MLDYWLDSLKEGFAGGIFDAASVYLGIAAFGWLGFLYNRRKSVHASRELKWMVAVTAYALLMSVIGKYWGPFMPFFIAVEAFMVSPVLANSFSNLFVSFMTGFHSFGSPTLDLSPARHARKVGKIDEAIDMALTELEKDPGHYEGNYLLAQIYWEQQEVHASFFCLVRILDNRNCTAEQRAQVREEFDHALAVARQRGWVPSDATQFSIRNALPSKLKRKAASG